MRGEGSQEEAIESDICQPEADEPEVVQPWAFGSEPLGEDMDEAGALRSDIAEMSSALSSVENPEEERDDIVRGVRENNRRV